MPLFELYNNQTTFGQAIASIPHLVSRFTFTIISANKPAASENTDATADATVKKEDAMEVEQGPLHFALVAI